MPKKVHNVNSFPHSFFSIEYPHKVPHSTVLLNSPTMPKISEKVTMRGAGRVETIPTALPGSDVTALRPPYIPSKADQEAVPNPGIISSLPHVSDGPWTTRNIRTT